MTTTSGSSKEDRDIDTSCIDCGCRQDNSWFRNMGMTPPRGTMSLFYPKWFLCLECKRKHQEFEEAANAAGM